MAKKILKNLQPAPLNLNIPGRKGSLHLAPAGREGAESEPIEVGPTGLGDEVARARRAGLVAVLDA